MKQFIDVIHTGPGGELARERCDVTDCTEDRIDDLLGGIIEGWILAPGDTISIGPVEDARVPQRCGRMQTALGARFGSPCMLEPGHDGPHVAAPGSGGT